MSYFRLLQSSMQFIQPLKGLQKANDFKARYARNFHQKSHFSEIIYRNLFSEFKDFDVTRVSFWKVLFPAFAESFVEELRENEENTPSPIFINSLRQIFRKRNTCFAVCGTAWASP